MGAYEIPSEYIALHFARKALMKECPACRKSFRDCDCSRWCEECHITTNHTTAQHEWMAMEQPEEPTR